jgi:hypothetical protein
MGIVFCVPPDKRQSVLELIEKYGIIWGGSRGRPTSVDQEYNDDFMLIEGNKLWHSASSCLDYDTEIPLENLETYLQVILL